MKLKRLLQIVEADLGGHVGFGGRPDDSGIRGKGVSRKPDKRMNVFPYDRGISYGQPGNSSDRGSNSVASVGHGQITPKDDETFSLTLMDLEGMVHEIMGSPILLARAGQSQQGSSIPGASGEWANNPAKDWDEAPGWADASDEPDSGYEYLSSMQDVRDTEHQLVDPTRYAEMDFHVISPDPWSVVNHALSSRGLQGRLPRESAWDRISGMTLEPRQNSAS